MRPVQMKIAPPQWHRSENSAKSMRMTELEKENKTVSERTCPGEFSDATCADENCSPVGAWECK